MRAPLRTICGSQWIRALNPGKVIQPRACDSQLIAGTACFGWLLLGLSAGIHWLTANGSVS